MAVQPLSPATDRRLGGPLPHQLPNQTRAHPCAINLWRTDHAVSTCYAVLASVSRRYPPHKGRLLTRYSPVRHWSDPKVVTVRLECVMHAASVHPEPGSNSRTVCILSPSGVKIFLSSYFVLAFLLFLKSSFSWFWQILYSHLLFCFVLISSVVQLSSFNPLPFLREPVYYITFISACQYLFWKKLKKFIRH